MTPQAPPLTNPAPTSMSPSLLSSINPQQMIESAIMNDITNTGGKNVGSITQGMSGIQPNQSAMGNRTAVQALSGFQNELANQGGTGGLGGYGKLAEAKAPGLLGQIIGGLGGAGIGAAAGGTAAAALGGTALAPLTGGLSLLLPAAAAYFGSKIGGGIGNAANSRTGPGQFEALRQSTAQQIASGTGMSAADALQYLPDYGENPQTAQTKMDTLQTMLSSGYAASVNPAQMGMPNQQSFGGVGLSSLPNQNVGNGMTSVYKAAREAAAPAATMATDTAAATGGASLEGLAEEALHI